MPIDVTMLGPCEPWTGSVRGDGYGVSGKTLAHRVVFEQHHRALLLGEQVDHLCHDPLVCKAGDDCPHRRCVAPGHLAAVSAHENLLRSNCPAALNARKTACPKGHFYDRPMTAEGKRRCNTCRREQFRRASERRKVKAAA